MRSLQGRLNLGILVGITVILALNGVLLYMVVRTRLVSELDQSLATVAQSFATRIPLELRSSDRPGSARSDYVLSGIHLRPPGRSDEGSSSAPIHAQELWESIHRLHSDARSILIDGVDRGLEEAGWMAHLLGMQSVALVPLGDDPVENDARIDRLIGLANEGDVDVAVVGREVLGSGVLTEAELRAHLGRARANLPNSVQLSTADSVEAYLDHPELLDDVDFLFPIYDPFARGVHIDGAVQQISCWHHDLVALARGKEVVVAEAGWPSSGDATGEAVPSALNAARFFTDFVTWARLNEVGYYYVSGIDGPGSDEAWGYRTRDGALKPGMRTVFDGLLLDLGEPTLDLMSPKEPDDVGFQLGFARNVPPLARGVAVYLRVGGRWWNKPSFAAPVTRIGCDGSWRTDITTGPGDENADAVVAFLLPLDFFPPVLDGADEIPQELFDLALSVAETEL